MSTAPIPIVTVCLALLTACTTAEKRTLGGPYRTFEGPYLGYDESRRFTADHDEPYSTGRPQYLKKYWAITPVVEADQAVLDTSNGRRLFEAEKDGYLYFCVPFEYEDYVMGPSEKDPNLVTTTAKYWVYGLDRYKIALRKHRNSVPNNLPEATSGQRPPATSSPSSGAPHL